MNTGHLNFRCPVCAVWSELATAAVVTASIATATIVAVTAAAEQEDKDDNPSTTATTKAIITHNQDLLFCLSSHTMLSLKIVLQKNILNIY